jgi:predicted NBD/HSP70 family sugar kinase/biotin operon repressor
MGNSVSVKTGDPEMARALNRALILNLIRTNDAIPRAQIARDLKLSKVTVSTIVNQLLEEGLLIEVGEGQSLKKGGRKPILLSLNTAANFVLGVDVGMKNTVVALGNLKGELIAKHRTLTVLERTVENVVDQVAVLLETLLDQAGLTRSNIFGLSVSVAGTVDYSSGQIVFSPDFKWRDVPLAAFLQAKTGFPTIVDNCTRLKTLGEIWYGRAHDVPNLFYINLGYSIGSAMVVAGRIYDKHCECGHTMITQKPIPCKCGKTGCLEALASGQAIERMANEQLGRADGEWITGKQLAELARQGNAAAQQIFAEAGRYVGRMTSIVANLFNPDKIIIGGGVAQAADLLLDSIQQEFAAHTLDGIDRQTRIEFAALSVDAAVLGAVALALNHFVFKQEIIQR